MRGTQTGLLSAIALFGGSRKAEFNRLMRFVNLHEIDVSITEQKIHAIAEFIGVLLIRNHRVKRGAGIVAGDVAIIAVQVDPVCLFLPGSAADFGWNCCASVGADEIGERERLSVHEQKASQVRGKAPRLSLE